MRIPRTPRRSTDRTGPAAAADDEPDAPQDLALRAKSILEQVRAISLTTRRLDPVTIDTVTSITDTLTAYHDAIERTSQRYTDRRDLPDVLSARRCISDAQVLVLGIIAELDAT